MTKTWYANDAARKLHYELQQELRPILSRLCPGYELSHAGINRSDITDEVVIVLHINPAGHVRVNTACDPHKRLP